MDGTSMTRHTPDRPTPGRRTRIAAQRAKAQRARARNRVLIAGGSIVAVIAVVVAFVVIQGSSSPSAGNGTAAPSGTALAEVLGKVTSVPVATSDKIGAGLTTAKPTSIAGAPLMAHGKPEMVYLGAEYCPYCAAERWAMIVALSRFGTFKGLAPTHSAAKDGGGHAEPFPNTPTWTFAKASFDSKYLTFTPVEMNTNIPDQATGGYTSLQNPTSAQQALLTKYDAAYQGAIPFVDFGNRYISVGASYDPAVLAGLTWSQIADDLHNTGSPVAKSVLGTANYFTAALCALTNNRPASACTPAVRSLQGKI
jgi:hypothetical protein